MRLVLMLALVALSGCTSLKEIDKPICVEINMSKAFCTKTISNEDFVVDDEHPYAFDAKKPKDKKTWFEMRPAMILVPPTTWAAFKSYLIKNCKRTGKCKGMIEGWDRSMNTLDQRLLDKTGAKIAPVMP